MDVVPPYDREVLLEQIAAGNERSFAILVDHHWNRIYSMAMAYLKSTSLAQDLVQDVFIKVWMKRSELPDMKDFDAWLFILSRNAMLDALKKNRRINLASESTLEGLLEPSSSTEQHYDHKRLNELLQEGIERLPAQQKLVFRMSFEQNLNHDEICEKLGIARQTLKNHLVRAFISLRTFLQTYRELVLAFGISILLFLKKNL